VYRDWNSIVGDSKLRSKLLSNYVEDPETGCWNWRAGTNNQYGAFYIRRKALINAHRAAYLLLVGAFPKDLEVCHHCDNKRCINPKHLFLGTQRENVEDYIRKHGRKPFKREYPPRFSPSQYQEIAALKAQGFAISEIARRFCCSRQAIYTALKKFDFMPI
jgi:hypothetical protein